jgi:methionine synthase I (cobalamin-dependent)
MAHAQVPVAIQSNAGMPEHVGGELVYPETPEFMASKVNELVDLGVSIIGGCCGTTPEHIRAIRAAVDAAA